MTVVLLALLSACSNSWSQTKEEREYYPSKEKAIEHYIQDYNIKGSVKLITTTKNENLLVTELRDNTYFVGEVMGDDGDFFTAKLSANYQSETGGAWELNSIEGNEYTIQLKTEDEANSKQLSIDEYTISFVEGHTISEDSPNHKNAIKEIEGVKE